MPVSRKRKPPAKTKGHPARREQSTTHWSTLKKISAALVATVGFVAAAVTFLPRVTVDPEGSLDPSSPYPISFRITNTGIIPLSDVQPILGICEFVVDIPKRMVDRCNGPLQSKLVPFPASIWHVNRLAMDEKYSIRLDDFLKIASSATFGGANISIIIEYRPWILPLHREKEFRFITRLESDGKLSWLSRPVDK
ncbi:MAG: hypothetical protein ACLP1W_19250 [Rhodomicrobium sp.]